MWRAVAALTTLALLASCTSEDRVAESGAETITVVASFYPMAEIASRVGADRVKVTNLTPVGTEPHDVELTTRQVDQLQDADLVVYLGKDFQPAVAKFAARRKRGRVDVLDGIQHDTDLHFWLDPSLMATAVDEVTGALTRISPTDSDAFEANASRYKDDLAALDADFARGLDGCARREIVTAHEAFSHLARRYGLTQLPIAGLSPEAEPDTARIAALTNVIRTKGITTVFYEELVSPEVAEALAREANVKTAVLNPIEGLSRDELDAGRDYLAVMRDNLAALRQALDCR